MSNSKFPKTKTPDNSFQEIVPVMELETEAAFLYFGMDKKNRSGTNPPLSFLYG